MMDHSGVAHHAPQAALAVSALRHSYLASTYFKWTLHAAEASVVKGAPKLALTLDKLVENYVAHGNQLIAMQTLAAFILIEISSSKPDPQQYRLEVGARLSGLAHTTARATKEGADTADYSSAEISTTIERVSAMIDAISGEN